MVGSWCQFTSTRKGVESMKEVIQTIFVGLMCTIGILALFYVIGQMVLFIEAHFNPFFLAIALFGVVFYGVLQLIWGEDDV